MCNETIFEKSALGMAVAIAATCALAVPVSAAGMMGGSGASYWRDSTNHSGSDRMINMPDGSLMPTVKITDSERDYLIQWESDRAGVKIGGIDADSFSVLNVAVGESVEVHVTQNGFDELGPLGMVLFRPGSTAHASIGTKSGKNQADMTADDMFVTPYNSSSGGYQDYCLELMVNGLEEGVDYLYFRDYSGLPGIYMKIIVGSAGSKSTSSGSSSSSSSNASSSTNKSSSGSSSSGNSSGASTSSGSSSESSGNSSSTPTTSANGSSYPVQAGDTLATIALNYYGDHQLWPYLQQVNQENLNNTANGLIYEDFVMHLPDTLNGVSRIAPPSVGNGETLYTVQAGDTYGTIALAHFGDMSRYEEIFNRNSDRLKDINTLIAGQIIVLP